MVNSWSPLAWPINGSPQSGFTLNLDENIFKSDEDFQLDAQDHKDVAYVAQMAAGLTYAGTFNHNYDTTQTTMTKYTFDDNGIIDNDNHTIYSLTTPQSNHSIWTDQTATTPHDHKRAISTKNSQPHHQHLRNNPKILHQITSTPSPMKSGVTITASSPNNNEADPTKHPIKRLSSNNPPTAKSKFVFITANNSGGTGARYTDSYSTQNNTQKGRGSGRATTPTPSTRMVKNKSTNEVEHTVIIHDNGDQLLTTPTHRNINTHRQSFVSNSQPYASIAMPISPSMQQTSASHHLLAIEPSPSNNSKPKPSPKYHTRPHACFVSQIDHIMFLRSREHVNISTF